MNSLRGSDDPTRVGWAVTALFYAAVHLVRAHLATKGVEVASHEDLRRLVDDHPELKKSMTDYKHLKQQSESARYYLNDSFKWADVDNLLARDLGRIRSTWEPLIRKAIAGVSAPPP